MIEWLRPTGSTIETNDDKRNIEAAKLLGWKRVNDKKNKKKERKAEVQQTLLGT